MDLQESWKYYEPSPIEFLHARIEEEFHKFRSNKNQGVDVVMNGIDLTNIIASAKLATYEKYEALNLKDPVKKLSLQKTDRMFTEEEEELRHINNMMNPEGKSCLNCQWGNAQASEDFSTCGRHLDNFSADSMCSSWTDPKDPRIQAYYNRRREELKQKASKPK